MSSKMKWEVGTAAVLTILALAFCLWAKMNGAYLLLLLVPWGLPLKQYSSEHELKYQRAMVEIASAHAHIKEICGNTPALQLRTEVLDLQTAWPVGFASTGPYGIAILGDLPGECILAPLKNRPSRWLVTMQGFGDGERLLKCFGFPYEMKGVWIVEVSQVEVPKQTWKEFLMDMRGSQFLQAVE